MRLPPKTTTGKWYSAWALSSALTFFMFKTQDKADKTSSFAKFIIKLRSKEFLDKLLAYTKMAFFQLDKNRDLWL